MITQVKHVIHVWSSNFIPEIRIKLVYWPINDRFECIFSGLQRQHLKFTQLFFVCMTNQGTQLLH